MGLFSSLFGYRPSNNAQPVPTVAVKQVSPSSPPGRSENSSNQHSMTLSSLPSQYQYRNSNSTRSNSGVPSIMPIPIDEDDETVVASTRSSRARRDINEKFIAPPSVAAADVDPSSLKNAGINSENNPKAAISTADRTGTHTAMIENNSNDMLDNDEELNALIQRVRSVHSTREPELSYNTPIIEPCGGDNSNNRAIVQHHPNPQKQRAQDDIILNKTLSTLSDHKSTGLSMERFMYLNIARTVSSLSLDMSIETCNMKEDLLDSMAECPVISLRDKAMDLRDGNNARSGANGRPRSSAGGNAVAANGRRKVVAAASIPLSKETNRDARNSANNGIVTTEQDLQRQEDQQQQIKEEYNHYHNQYTKRGRPSGTTRRRYSDPGNLDSILVADLVKQQDLAKKRTNQENNGKLERFIEATAPDGKNRKLARALQIKDERDKEKTSKKALLYEVAMRLEEARKKKRESMREELRASRRTMAQVSGRRGRENSGTSMLAYEVAKKREKAMLDRIAWKKKVERIEKRVLKIQSCG
mmetsp:Transcript_11513/g.17373  ORF Transcript_11513/g.17373 Transcript_11513/m.17373 type:complete len:530 (+) Transcript_11513:128-1717(+)|eukprot:CAMPEP_0196811712 /NCGR_PEP_ID=MMETSP1362-20130617/20019_1 /TAXON_ID=163516 /ORGANISM="Leptocylindrus danicus, Strain CCMP1856" /LENGTH=529 /DNA_ID=CAMNT_0042187089 /DNA_START=65 /DNA_END=1654 /DNA_ORIENTATION=-